MKATRNIVIYAFFIMYIRFVVPLFFSFISPVYLLSNIVFACHIDFVVCLRKTCLFTMRLGYFLLTAQFPVTHIIYFIRLPLSVS